MIYNISNSEKIKQDYDRLLQKVRIDFSPQDRKQLGLEKSKVSRVLNSKQFDLLTLSDMASICGVDCNINFLERR